MILRPNDLSCAWTAVKTFFNFESRQVAFKDRTRNQARDQTRVSKEPAGLDFEPAGLDFEPAGLELKPVGLELEPAGLEFGPKLA